MASDGAASSTDFALGEVLAGPVVASWSLHSFLTTYDTVLGSPGFLANLCTDPKISCWDLLSAQSGSCIGRVVRDLYKLKVRGDIKKVVGLHAAGVVDSCIVVRRYYLCSKASATAGGEEEFCIFQGSASVWNALLSEVVVEEISMDVFKMSVGSLSIQLLFSTDNIASTIRWHKDHYKG